MIANFFNKSKPINLIILLIGLTIFYGCFQFIINATTFLDFFTINNSGFLFVLIFTLLIVNFIIYKNQLTSDHYYALLILVLLFGIFPKTMMWNNYFIANLFILFALRKAFNLRTYKSTNLKLFDGGFWIGIATIFFNLSFFYLLLFYISLIIYRKIKMNALIIPIVGFITPLFLYFTYCFYLDEVPKFLEILDFNINIDLTIYNNTIVLVPLIFLILVSILAVLSVTYKIFNISKDFNLQWILIVNSLLISVIVVILSNTKNTSEFIFLFFPTALVIANYLERLTSEINKNFILFVLLGLTGSVYFL